MATTAKETFKSILKKGNKSIQATRANRFAKTAKIEYDGLVNKKYLEIIAVEDELEGMADISTSNNTTTVNRTGTKFDAKTFVKDRANLKLKLATLTEEYNLLKEDEYFYN